MVAAMSIDEALKRVGHLVPQEVKAILAQGSLSNGQSPASGEYDGLKGVIDKINEMYLSTFKDLDITKIECMTSLTDLKAEQYQLQQDDKRMTGDLADDQASLIDWTSTKQNAIKEISKLKDGLNRNIETCNRDISAANDLLKSMQGDFNVSNTVVMNSDCAKALGSRSPPKTNENNIVKEDDKRAWYSSQSGNGTAALLDLSALVDTSVSTKEQLDAANADPDSPLYARKPFDLRHPVYLDDDDLMLHKGEVLLQCILPSGESFLTFQKPAAAEAILQLTSHHFVKIQKKMIALLQMANDTAPVNATNATQTTPSNGLPAGPAATSVPKKIQDAKCSISGSPQCPKFLESLAALVTEIKTSIVLQQRYIHRVTENCTKVNNEFMENIASYQKNLDLANTRIGQLNSRSTQVQASLDQVRKTAKAKAAMYNKKYRECNQATSDANAVICGIQKIKTDLMRMSKVPDFIQDCVVSKFVYGPCSATCGPDGGLQNLTRAVTTPPTSKWGADCPALTAVAVCNKIPCPVDCKTGPWTDYTRCSANCGTGSKFRFRDVLLEPRFNGHPCGARQEMAICGQETCDKDCVLSEWTAFSSCSTACGGGDKERRRNVLVASKGQGFCPKAEESRRFEVQKCNTQACPPNKPICQAKVDLLFLIDMSGSVGTNGLEKQVEFVTNMVQQFDFTYSRIGLILFSTDVLVWAPLTADKNWLLARLVQVPPVWQGQLAATAQALSKAKTLLTDGGRQDAASIVMVVTDSMPTGPVPTMDEEVKTPQAADDLKRVSRLMFIAVGSQGAKAIQKFREWSSEGGKYNNFAQVPTFNVLPEAADDLIIKMCPEIKGIVPPPAPHASVVNPTTQTTPQFPMNIVNSVKNALSKLFGGRLIQSTEQLSKMKANYGVVSWGDDVDTDEDEDPENSMYGPAPDLSIA